MNKEANRIPIICLHQRKKLASEISRLQNILRRTIYDAIRRFFEFGTTKDCSRSGRSRTINTLANRQTIKNRLLQNPERSMRQMNKGIKCSEASIRRIVENDLIYYPYTERNLVQMLPLAVELLR